jgi:predicted permease
MLFLLFEKMAGLAILAALGFIFIRRNFIKDSDLNFLSWLVIDVTMPALFFVQVINGGFSFENKGLFYCFIAGLLIPFSAYALSFPIFSKFPLKSGEKSAIRFAAVVGNTSFIPLPLAMALWGSDGVNACLAYVLGSNIFLFSFGIAMLGESHVDKKPLFLMVFKHPQALAFAAGVILFFFHLSPPGWVLEPLDALGKATIPLAMLITGGILGRESFSLEGKRWPLLILALFKLLLVPALVYIAVLPFKNSQIANLYLSLILLEASMPSLASAAAYARRFGGDAGMASSGTLITTLCSLITVPFWMQLWMS